jgi:murein L,D-transpeptidase YcbB/YkuD
MGMGGYPRLTVCALSLLAMGGSATLSAAASERTPGRIQDRAPERSQSRIVIPDLPFTISPPVTDGRSLDGLAAPRVPLPEPVQAPVVIDVEAIRRELAQEQRRLREERTLSSISSVPSNERAVQPAALDPTPAITSATAPADAAPAPAPLSMSDVSTAAPIASARPIDPTAVPQAAHPVTELSGQGPAVAADHPRREAELSPANTPLSVAQRADTRVTVPALDLPQTLASLVIEPPTILQGQGDSSEDQPLPLDPQSEALRLALGGLAADARLTPADREAIGAFYGARMFKPLWVSTATWSPAARDVIAVLNRADNEGLEAERYRVPTTIVQTAEPVWHALASAEVRLSSAAVVYAREASTGRVPPRRVHALITVSLAPPAAGQVLTELAAAAHAGDRLLAYNPPHQGYQRLRAKLAEVRQARNVGPSVRIPAGPIIRVGMRDERVPLIRARFGLGYEGDTTYDQATATRVADFQRLSGLPATGVVTRQTVAALTGGPSSDLEADLVANMERWRWLPRDLGRRHILVNVPEYRLGLVVDGVERHTARAIVGKDETQTPVFSDLMDHVVVNPSWTIPPGMLRRNPKYLDPDYAEARGYQIIRRGNNVTVRQPPGDDNALGYIKFMFPNDHAVYLHDTPSRNLFNASDRALSNGCVRVQDPFELAAQIFEDEGWSKQRFLGLIGRGERMIRLREKLPIHLVYFTLSVDADGDVRRHGDIYGHNRRLKTLLGLS